MDFELEERLETAPTNDYLEVFDGSSDGDSTSLGKFYGSQIPGYIQTNGSALIIQFYSDKNGNKKGFKIKYSIGKCYENA